MPSTYVLHQNGVVPIVADFGRQGVAPCLCTVTDVVKGVVQRPLLLVLVALGSRRTSIVFWRSPFGLAIQLDRIGQVLSSSGGM